MNLSGNPVDFLIAFFGGVLVSFTPCVYPLIPISAGFIGIRSAGSRAKGLFLSLVYVSGIAVIYSLLGLIAVSSGSLFGEISSSPAAYLLAGGVIIFFALFMSDLLILRLPRLPELSLGKNKGYLSVFLLGLTSGMITSPCLTPVLGSILAYLATKKNLLYGALLLFSFAYGMGLILIIAGTFGSFILGLLPKSGRWTVYVKKLYALILLAMGLYFIYAGLRRL
ncbi:MAG: cytochrome c biogenesis protein CcdA [Candidatus Omnitrophota bacterium]|nr:cytochrome c biogenesis protein CcdA [Candidatus Omnitrophota bacterium]